MEVYLNASVAPKGMLLSLPSAIANLEQNDQSEWNSILLDASLKLVKVVINNSEKQLNKVNTSITNLLRLSDPLSKDEQTALTEFEQKKRRELEIIKLRKLKRDKVSNTVLVPTTFLNDNVDTHMPSNAAESTRRAEVNPSDINGVGGPAIVNLSGIPLSADEENLLSKGLNFCPSTGLFDEFQILKDLDDFSRNLRLREYFLDKPSNSDDARPRPKYDWTPNTRRDNCLDLYIAAVQKDILKQYRKGGKKSHNLTKSERESLKSLSTRSDIVIKPADKGGAIVILNTNDYIQEGNRQLNDPNFYEHLTGDPTPRYAKIVSSTLEELLKGGKITANEHKLLKPAHPSLGRFYMLPKIHKTGNPGRPIISGVGTITEPISGYVDELIRHIPLSLSSYIKDTTHFLREISGLDVPEGSLLVTLDVSSLYTNIPHDDGIIALIDMYELHRKTGTPDSHVVATLTRLVLELNAFEFNDKHFRQVSGTAMGTKMAPSYANIFMGMLESKFLADYPFQPLVYKRFIDDIFIIWTHGEDELRYFINKYNQAHPTIKFTPVYSSTSVNFLDVTVTIDNGKLTTKLYRKPSDRQQYLHYRSDHPRHCKNSIPYSQAHRFKRICAKKDDFDINAEKLRTVLRHQKYPPRVIDDAIKKASELNRADLLENRTKQRDTQRTNLCLTYSSNYPQVNNILRRHYNILEQSERLKRAFPSAPGVIYRRSRNLKDTLVKSKLNLSQSNNGCKPCMKTKCLICKQMRETSTASSTGSQFNIKIRSQLSCDSSNVIYLLQCSVCDMQYVGQTETAFRLRFNNHRAHAVSLPNLPLSKHVCLPKHSFDKLTVTLLETGFKSNREREQRESYLIYRFNTIEKGINESPGTLASIELLSKPRQ